MLSPLPPLLQTAAQPSAGAEHWLALDRQLCFALYSASLAMTKAYKPLLAPLGLTYPRYLVMLALWQADGSTVSALGDRLRLDSGTLTPLLKRLQQQGLLLRQRDALDERRVRVQLSSAGLALKGRALAVPQAIACAAACDLQQLAALTEQLRSLRDQLTRAGQAGSVKDFPPVTAQTLGLDSAP